MKKGEQALPTFFRVALNQATKVVKKKPKKEDEDTLIGLAEHEGWLKVKEIIEDKQVTLAKMTKEACRTAQTLDEIGFRYAILDQVTEAMQSVVDTVELPYNARVHEVSNKK